MVPANRFDRATSAVRALIEVLAIAPPPSVREGVATVLLKPGAVGRTAESIAAWKRQVSAQLDRFGRKVPLLICVDGGVVSPSLAEQFGTAAKEILDRYVEQLSPRQCEVLELLFKGLRQEVGTALVRHGVEVGPALPIVVAQHVCMRSPL
jgi:hypothetical protein